MCNHNLGAGAATQCFFYTPLCLGIKGAGSFIEDQD